MTFTKIAYFFRVINDSGKILESKYVFLIPDLDRLASDMQHYGVSELTIENTSIYRIPIRWGLKEMFAVKLSTLIS